MYIHQNITVHHCTLWIVAPSSTWINLSHIVGFQCLRINSTYRKATMFWLTNEKEEKLKFKLPFLNISWESDWHRLILFYIIQIHFISGYITPLDHCQSIVNNLNLYVYIESIHNDIFIFAKLFKCKNYLSLSIQSGILSIVKYILSLSRLLFLVSFLKPLIKDKCLNMLGI